MKISRIGMRCGVIATAAIAGLLPPTAAMADNQTPTTSPITVGDAALPFTLSLEKIRPVGKLPALQSYSAGSFGNYIVLVGGGTGGVHDFEENHNIVVIDTRTWQSWSRSILNAGLTQDQIDELSAGNAESVQAHGKLYVLGGYGNSRSLNTYTTFNTLTALDLAPLVNWVQHPRSLQNLSAMMRQTSDNLLRVTGGQATLLGNRVQLAFGQDYEGSYMDGDSVQKYTGQVRSFTISDDGHQVSITNTMATPSTPNLNDFRRRDYPMGTYMNYGKKAAVALGGVFTETMGAYTVPVEIGATGAPVEDAPTDPATFKQGMNIYDCATLSVYDASNQESHNVLFGGITYMSYDASTGKFTAHGDFPFTNQITDIVRRNRGQYSQYLLPTSFPTILDSHGEQTLYGTDAHVFLNPNIPTAADGSMVNLQALPADSTDTVIGWIYGGIADTEGAYGTTTASDQAFAITLHRK